MNWRERGGRRAASPPPPLLLAAELPMVLTWGKARPEGGRKGEGCGVCAFRPF